MDLVALRPRHLTPYARNRGSLCFSLWLDLTQLQSVWKTDALPMSYIATYQDVLPQLLNGVLAPPNTTRLMSFSLRDTQPCFRTTSLFGPFSLALPVALGCKPRTDRTTRSPYALDGFACLAWIASPLAPSPLAWAPSFRTKLHLPAYHGRFPWTLSGRSGLAWMDHLRDAGT